MTSHLFYRLALVIRRLSIWAYRMSELPERFVATVAVCAAVVVTLVVWPPHWSGPDRPDKENVT